MQTAPVTGDSIAAAAGFLAVVILVASLLPLLSVIFLGMVSHHLYRIQQALEQLVWIQSRHVVQPQVPQTAGPPPTAGPGGENARIPTFGLLR